MNILFISRSYYPHIGGVEKHAREIARRLIKRGHKVVVVTELESKEKQEDLKDGVKIIRFYYPKIKLLGLLRIWLWFINNLQLVKEANIVHIHDVFIWYLPLHFLFPKKPIFVTFHGWEGRFPISLVYKFLRKISEKLSWGNICVGKYLEKWYGTKPDYTIYGGVNRSIKIQNYNSKLKIVYLGRLTSEFGLSIFLDALKLLRLPKTQVAFLGDGPLRDECQKFGKVFGFVEDINKYLTTTRFVFALGYLSILEGMVARKLVFAAYNNPLREDYLKMAPFAKWIISEKSPKQLAEKVLYYLRHPEKERTMVEEAYKWAKEQTWDKIVNLYLQLWQLK